MGKKTSIWELVLKTTGVSEKLAKVSGMSDVVSNKFTKTQDRINQVRLGFKQMANEIPGLNQALNLLTNPMALTAAGLLLITTTSISATKAAAEFQHQFLELKQLNLDKPKEELSALNALVLDTAWNTGIAPKQMAKGYYDLQSATGMYGKAAEGVLTKIGEFSHVTKANFDDLVNSVGKASGMFGLDAQNIDDYLASMAKTVQLGITTYDELASVQADYLGAAASAGQGFDEANKMFAAMTKVSKSAQEGATLTKTAFKGLIDPRVQQGLQQWGVSMFDAQGKMIGLDDITVQLADKLAGMSDQDFSNFMGDVGGPEGMQAYLSAIKNNASDVLNAFDQFDKVDFDINKAIENAHGDFETLKNMVSNRFQVVMVQLGQVILPSVVRAMQWLLDVQSKAMGWWGENGGLIMDAISGIWSVFKLLFNILKPLVVVVGVLTAAIWLMSTPIVWIPLAIMAVVGAVSVLWNRFEGFRGTVLGLWEVLKGLGTMIKEYLLVRFTELLNGVTGIFSALWKAMNGDLKGAVATGKEAVLDLVGADSKKVIYDGAKEIGTNFQNGFNEGKSQVQSHLAAGEEKTAGSSSMSVQSLFTGGTNDSETQSTAQDEKLAKGLTTVSGGGKTVRDVRVTIGKLVESITVRADNVKEGAEDIRDIIQEELIKAMQGYEMATN